MKYRKAAVMADAANNQQIAAQFHGYADYCDSVSNELLNDVPACKVEAGEVVATERQRHDANGGYALRNTLATPRTAAISASLERTELLTQTYTDVLALGIDAAQSIEGANSLEKMLAHQMALAHKSAFRLSEMAMQQRDPMEATRLSNACARMMSVYQSGLLALHHLRASGKQTVTVQHVNVNGGQAVVAAHVQTGGRSSESEGKD